MFPAAGYFRSTNCPFFVHGLCHRPYCHFRHSKPGLKATKSKISPHKHKVDEHKRTEGASDDHTQHVSKVTASNSTANALLADGADKEENLKTTTTIRGILKKPHEDASQQSNKKVTLDNVDQQTAVTNSSDMDDTVTMDGDDTEQPIAALTDEEKQIIGLMSHPPCGSNDLIAIKSSDEMLSPVSNAANGSSLNTNVTVQTDLVKGSKSGESQDHVCVNMTGISKETEVMEVKNGSSYNSTICPDGTEKTADKMSTDFEQESVAQCVVTNEEAEKSLSKKRKSVQLKTQGLDLMSKKRRSQQLPCATECLSPASLVKCEKDDGKCEKVKVREDAKKRETMLHKLFESSSKLLVEDIDSATKKSPEEKDSLAKDTMSHSPSERLKLIGDCAISLNKKAPVLEAPSNTHAVKKKVNIAETEINFFGSSKKASKSIKIEKNKKSKEKRPLMKTSKTTQLEARQKQRKDLTGKFSRGITILISDESDSFSAPNCDSSSEEDSHLKRIWNDFEPQNDFVVTEDSPSPSKNQTNRLAETKKLPFAAVATVVEKPTSLVNTLGLGKKQRVAHTANHLPRRVSSNANPVRKYPKTLASVHKKDEHASPSTSVESSVNASLSYKPVKQRVAHVAKSSTPAGSLPRPRIPVEYGAKVPQNQRQRYLDRIIDEYLRLYPTEKQAFEKAVEEEKALYERSTRRQVYLNLCVNAIKKLRDTTPQDVAASSPVKAETEARVAVTKTLPSGAVVVSTKSPAKQDQPVKPAADDLTEDVMYNYLSKYLMTEEDLVDNGYPRPCLTSPGKAVFKMKKEQASKDPSRRTCRRCGKPFVVLEDGEYLTKEECIYHAGKLFRKRGEQITSYSCCQGDAGSPGCCVGKVHVSDDTYNTDGFMTTIVSPLTDQRKKIFAMDCEMCYTTAGLELTRITVVNWNLEVVYDTFVMPERTIVDYNTRFSGVTEESLRGVTTTIREVQAVLLSMIHKDTILVGHSLESDLKATKLIHSKAVDTSVVFPHRMGPPYKRALRNLMADYLKKIIQDSVEGHDSFEDAKACLELMRWKVKEDMKKTTRHKSPRLSVG